MDSCVYVQTKLRFYRPSKKGCTGISSGKAPLSPGQERPCTKMFSIFFGGGGKGGRTARHPRTALRRGVSFRTYSGNWLGRIFPVPPNHPSWSMWPFSPVLISANFMLQFLFIYIIFINIMNVIYYFLFAEDPVFLKLRVRVPPVPPSSEGHLFF